MKINMNVKYIIRLDDACPTMDMEKWQLFEDMFDKYDIKPIMAVIPNNNDPKQKINKFDNDFWNKVRDWQKKGWHIALHGYDHVYISNHSGLVPFNNKSEFAGLSYQKQSEKIKKGIEIFKKEGIETNIWVAPSHTFDENTLKALKEHTTIKIISDGIALFPFKRFRFFWIPQQLWKYKNKNNGIYTICYHPNTMSKDNILKELNLLKNNKNKIINNINDLEIKYKDRSLNIFDFIYEYFFLYKRSLFNFINRKRYLWKK